MWRLRHTYNDYCKVFRRILFAISIVGGFSSIIIKAIDAWVVKLKGGMWFFWLQVVVLGGFMLAISLVKIS